MEDAKNLDEIIRSSFAEFSEKYKVNFEKKIAFQERYSINPWFGKEDTIKVKFGGILENYFRNQETNYSVCSEIKIDSKKDLTIHQINGTLWTTHNDIYNSLRAVIEIKYACYHKTNNAIFLKGLDLDIIKLCSLKSNIKKYLLIFDEGCKLGKKVIEQTKEKAKKNEIKILSNNPQLMEKIIQ